MLSKCLNPCCSATFQYLRQGRLFRIDFTEADRRSARSGQQIVDSQRGNARPSEHFWLCEKCAATMTIAVNGIGEVRLVPLEWPARQPPPGPASEANGSRQPAARCLPLHLACDE
jgi:hypothetical protein